MKLKTLTAALCLGLASLSLPAFALTPDAPAVPGTVAGEAPAPQSHHDRWHDADPQQREQWRQRHDKCMADAACKTRLEARKAKHEERRKACAADPEKCQAERQERRQRHEARRAKCAADADCKAKMERRRAAREERCNQDPSQCMPPRKPWEGTGTAPAAPR